LERTFWQWIFFILEKYGWWFVRGTGVTLFIALLGTVIGFTIGILIGTIRTIPVNNYEKGFSFRKLFIKLVNLFLTIYIEIFRGTPMMIQAIVIYYGLQEAFNIDLNAITAAIIIVSINTGAYMSEIVRGGIESIDSGQTEAAHAIGMTHTQTMFNVILPQTIRNILPATGNEFIINIKDTSVLNVISVTELFFMTKSVKGAVFQTYPTYLIAACIYLFLTLTITKLLRMLEKKIDGPSSYSVLGTSSTLVPAKRKSSR
jgi:putative lysine transport system permease protein